MKYLTALAVLGCNQTCFCPALLVYTAALSHLELCTMLSASSIITYAVLAPTPCL